MPSPVGHALAGLAMGWAAEAITRTSERTPETIDASGRPARVRLGYPLLGVVLAVAPDLDILLDSHRTVTHSMGGALLAGAVLWVASRLAGRRWWVLSATCVAAIGSHAVADWLGRDSSAPTGVMLLWPFSREFYASGLDVFAEISRRYWNPDEFVFGNLRSVAQELAVLGPVATVAWLWARHRRRPPIAFRGGSPGTRGAAFAPTDGAGPEPRPQA